MTQQKRNPDIDFGFHATIPRAVRTEYEKLTPMQKWLYVCLKDLCGEHGTCYRALRVLAVETHISTGMLSESIPMLHKAGLIHAEKKRRSSGGKEVWHITIIDIWAANGKLHPTKRSHSEQTSENVHTVNNNVHSVNNQGEKRSLAEQERSLCETEEGSSSSIITEEGSGEEGTYGANAPTHADFSQQREKVEKRITHPRIEAVSQEMLEQAQHEHANETPYHIAAAIGNDAEEEETPTVKMQAVKIGATHEHTTDHRSDLGKLHSDNADTASNRPVSRGKDAISASEMVGISEQTPGPGALPSSAESPQFGRSSGIISDQAPSSLPFVAPPPAQSAGSTSPAVTVRPPAQASGRKTVPNRPVTSAPILTLEEQAVIDRWSIAMKKTYPLTDSLIKASKLLAPCNPSVEDLKAVRGFCFASNPDWFAKQRKGAVTLLDIAKNWEAWQSSQEQPQEQSKVPPEDWKPAENDYSIKAQLWRQEHMTRSGK